MEILNRVSSFRRWSLPLLAGAVMLVVSPARPQNPPAAGQPPPPAKPAAAASKAANKKAPAAPPTTGPNGEIYIHAFHQDKLGGLECSVCHTAVSDGSVELKRPGHDQCGTCHGDDFANNYSAARPTICAQCHTAASPKAASKNDLIPFPRYRGTRAILFQFSHAKHVDKDGRQDPRTGFRSDCTFCHKFDAQGVFAMFPGHTQCAACHSKPGVKPQLTAALDSETCAGCHTVQEIENPGFTKNRRLITQTAVSGKYVDIKFVHSAHFAVRQKFNLDCTTCHYAIPQSTSLSTLSLPKMEDCVSCHDMAQRVGTEFRMSNCSVCHAGTADGLFTPASHTRNVKPASHTENFRIQHQTAAAAEGAKCFVCHLNVAPSVTVNNQCMECHAVMKPASHTARWKDDLHGKYAAIDRTTCATCHRADYCIDCHNELPRSHFPLPVFTGGGHATLALLDTRSCLTCHTFQNTCSLCHTGGLTSLTRKPK